MELSEQNWDAWGHYRECRAVGSFPADPIVRRLAAVCRQVEDAFERQAVTGRLDRLVTAWENLRRG